MSVAATLANGKTMLRFFVATSMSKSKLVHHTGARFLRSPHARGCGALDSILRRETAHRHLAQHFFLLVGPADDFLERGDELLLVVD